MRLGRKQQGMSMIGWLVTITILFFTFTLGIRLFPVYLDSFKLSSILSAIEKDPNMVNASGGQIVERITRQLKTDRIDSIGPENVYVNNAGNEVEVEIEYEVRVDFIGNLDLLANFKKQIVIKGH